VSCSVWGLACELCVNVGFVLVEHAVLGSDEVGTGSVGDSLGLGLTILDGDDDGLLHVSSEGSVLLDSQSAFSLALLLEVTDDTGEHLEARLHRLVVSSENLVRVSRRVEKSSLTEAMPARGSAARTPVQLQHRVAQAWHRTAVTAASRRRTKLPKPSREAQDLQTRSSRTRR